MITALVVTLAVGGLLVLPGALVARCSGLSLWVSSALGPAVTLGMVGIETLWLGFTPVRWSLVTALAGLIIISAAATYYARLKPPMEARFPLSITAMSIVSVGVIFGAGIYILTCMRWLQRHTSRGFNNISQVWDALWHANLIRFMNETGVASPIRTGELINSDNHDAHFYPNAWHALVSLVHPLAHDVGITAGYPLLYNVASVVTPAIVMPLGMAALSWRLTREKFGEVQSALGASAAAAVWSLFPSLYEEQAFGSVPSATALALAPSVAVVVMSSVHDRTRLPLAVVAFAGVTATHPSGAVLVALIVIFWWAGHLLWTPERTRVKDVLALAVVPCAAAILLGPLVLGVASASEETDAFPFFWYDLNLTHGQALFRSVSLLARTADESVPYEHRMHLLLPLMAVAAVGLLIVAWLRQWWLLSFWALLVLVATNDLVPFGPGICHPYPQCGPLPLDGEGKPAVDWPAGTVPWLLDKVSSSFYHDPHRLAEILTLLSVTFCGVAVAGCCAGLAAFLKTTRRLQECITGGFALLGCVWMLVYANHVRVERGALAASTRNDWLVGQEDINAYHWLSTRPGAHNSVILNQLEEGTGWMYAESGLHPMFAHYRSPSFSADQACLYWFAASAGKDWRVAHALRRLKVYYAMESPPNYWWDHANPFTQLNHQPGVTAIYRDGPVTIYQFHHLAKYRNQVDPLVSKDPNHFCRG